MFDRQSALINAIQSLRKYAYSNNEAERNIKEANAWVRIAEAMEDDDELDV